MALKGWVRLYYWKKFHWIENRESLCGKWMFLGQDPQAFDDDTTVKKDECVVCRKKLDKMIK